MTGASTRESRAGNGLAVRKRPDFPQQPHGGTAACRRGHTGNGSIWLHARAQPGTALMDELRVWVHGVVRVHVTRGESKYIRPENIISHSAKDGIA